jgi:hypothetical protein
MGSSVILAPMLTFLCPETLTEPVESPDSAASSEAAGLSAPDGPTEQFHPNRTASPTAISPTDKQMLSLAHRLRRARVTDRWHDASPVPRQSPAHTWLSSRFSLKEHHAGALRLYARDDERAHGTAAQMVITPVHLHAGLDHLVLQPPASLSVTQQEADALISTANEFLAEDNISLAQVSPDCWLLHMPSKLEVDLCDHALAVGRNIAAYLPDGPHARKLRALLNELQMLWHEHPVNMARDEAQLPRINALWPEGYPITLPTRDEPVEQPFDLVVSDNPVTMGLAICHGLPVQHFLGVDATHVSALQAKDQRVLIELAGGPDAVTSLLDANPTLPASLVLTNNHVWVQVQLSRFDAWSIWRRARLS